MLCFLLPNTICSELESIIGQFWWCKSNNKRATHWCTLKHLCELKDYGGLGFRSLSKSNLALLAKQGWRLLSYSNSLLARTLEAKYFPTKGFLESSLGQLPYHTWRSIWVTKGILEVSMC